LYVTVEIEVWPSLLVAVTLNVCWPGEDVLTGLPDPWSSWSRQDAIPGPPASAQLKLEVTAWFTAYVASFPGDVIEAVGGPATL
jgi:hypothetical protein